MFDQVFQGPPYAASPVGSGNTELALDQVNGVLLAPDGAGGWNNGSQNTIAYGTNTATANTTLTAANIAAKLPVEVVLNLTGALGGAANATLPTAAATIARVVGAKTGQTYRLRIINSSSGAFTWTIVTALGWTLTGTMTIPQNTWREFVVTFNIASATATLVSIGTGTFS